MAKKILIVDDDPTAIKIVQGILKSHDFDIITAEDGLDALSKIQKENPDLVVLDVMMPEINGYDVCFQLRFNDSFEKIPIVLLTSRDQELDGNLGQRINIEYLQKPVDGDKLLELIDQLLA